MLNRGENIEVNREVVHHENFLLFPECSQKMSAVNVSKCICLSESVNISQEKILDTWKIVSFVLTHI